MKKTYQSPTTTVTNIALTQSILQVSGSESLEGTRYGGGSQGMSNRTGDVKGRTGTWEDLMW